MLNKMLKDVRELQESYKQLSWFQRLFFPKSLGRVLDELKNDDPTSLPAVYKAFTPIYNSRLWFISSFFFSFLKTFSCVGRMNFSVWPSKPLPGRTDIMINASQSGLFEGDLTKEILNAIDSVGHMTKWLIDILVILKKSELLTKANIDTVKNDARQCSDIVTSLETLYKMGLLNSTHGQANFSALVQIDKNGNSLEELLKKQKIDQGEFNKSIVSCKQEMPKPDTSTEQIKLEGSATDESIQPSLSVTETTVRTQNISKVYSDSVPQCSLYSHKPKKESAIDSTNVPPLDNRIIF